MLRRSLIRAYGQQKHKDFNPHSQHYLLVHDAVKLVSPTVRIVANITGRKPFQTHMQVLFDDPAFDHTRIPRFADQLQKKLESGFIDSDPAFPYRLKLRFFDNTHLTIALGRDNVTVKDVITCDDDAERDLLRASLGCDELDFRDTRSNLVTMAASMCIIHQKYRMGEDFMYIVPRLFWLAYCDHIYNECPQDFPAPSVLSGEAAKTFYSRRDPLWNPVLPQEDLLLLPSVRYLRHMSSSSFFSGSNAMADMQRQVNIVDTGIVPTQEEYEEMLIRKGIVEPPAPKKPGFFSRMMGWDKKAADEATEETADAKGKVGADGNAEDDDEPAEPRAPRPVDATGPITFDNIPDGAHVSPMMRSDYADGDEMVGREIGRMWVEIGRRK